MNQNFVNAHFIGNNSTLIINEKSQCSQNYFKCTEMLLIIKEPLCKLKVIKVVEVD